MTRVEDSSPGDSIRRTDDPTIGGVSQGDDPTIANTLMQADDSSDNTAIHVDDPTVANITVQANIPTMVFNDSDEGVVENYYEGIEEQKRKGYHPDDEFQRISCDGQKFDVDAFQQEMNPASLDEGTFASSESHCDDEEARPHHSYTDAPSTLLQESEYVSMQELYPRSPDVSHNMEVEGGDKKSPEMVSHTDPPAMPQKDKPSEQPTGITNYAGYGFARQFSSTPRRSKLSSPKYANTQKVTPQIQRKSRQFTYDDTSVDNLAPDDETSHQSSVDPPVFSISSFEDVASPQSRESKVSPDSSHTQGTSSTAMIGARKLLKKNRQERLALMAKRKQAQQKTPVLTSRKQETSVFGNENKEPDKTKILFSHARSRSVTPNKRRFRAGASSPASSLKISLSPASPPSGVFPPKSPPSSRKTQNKNSSFGSPKSDISACSSAWFDEPDADKDSRRALILKMAKNRMRSKKELRNT